MKETRWISLAEASELAGVSVETLRRYTRSGRLVARKRLAKAIEVSEEQIRALAAPRELPPDYPLLRVWKKSATAKSDKVAPKEIVK